MSKIPEELEGINKEPRSGDSMPQHTVVDIRSSCGAIRPTAKRFMICSALKSGLHYIAGYIFKICSALKSGLLFIVGYIAHAILGLCAFLVIIPAAAMVWLISVVLVGVVHALYTYIAGFSEEIMNRFFSGLVDYASKAVSNLVSKHLKINLKTHMCRTTAVDTAVDNGVEGDGLKKEEIKEIVDKAFATTQYLFKGAADYHEDWQVFYETNVFKNEKDREGTTDWDSSSKDSLEESIKRARSMCENDKEYGGFVVVETEKKAYMKKHAPWRLVNVAKKQKGQDHTEFPNATTFVALKDVGLKEEEIKKIMGKAFATTQDLIKGATNNHEDWQVFYETNVFKNEKDTEGTTDWDSSSKDSLEESIKRARNMCENDKEYGGFVVVETEKKAYMKKHAPWRLVNVAKKQKGQDPMKFPNATTFVAPSRQIPFSIRELLMGGEAGQALLFLYNKWTRAITHPTPLAALWSKVALTTILYVSLLAFVAYEYRESYHEARGANVPVITFDDFAVGTQMPFLVSATSCILEIRSNPSLAGVRITDYTLSPPMTPRKSRVSLYKSEFSLVSKCTGPAKNDGFTTQALIEIGNAANLLETSIAVFGSSRSSVLITGPPSLGSKLYVSGEDVIFQGDFSQSSFGWNNVDSMDFITSHGLVDLRFSGDELVSLPSINVDVGTASVSIEVPEGLHSLLHNMTLLSGSGGGADKDLCMSSTAGKPILKMTSNTSSTTTVDFGQSLEVTRPITITRGSDGLAQGQLHASAGLLSGNITQRSKKNTLDSLQPSAGSSAAFLVEPRFAAWASDRIAYGHEILRLRVVGAGMQKSAVGGDSAIRGWEWIVSKAGTVHLWHPQAIFYVLTFGIFEPSAARTEVLLQRTRCMNSMNVDSRFLESSYMSCTASSDTCSSSSSVLDELHGYGDGGGAIAEEIHAAIWQSLPGELQQRNLSRSEISLIRSPALTDQSKMTWSERLGWFEKRRSMLSALTDGTVALFRTDGSNDGQTSSLIDVFDDDADQVMGWTGWIFRRVGWSALILAPIVVAYVTKQAFGVLQEDFIRRRADAMLPFVEKEKPLKKSNTVFEPDDLKDIVTKVLTNENQWLLALIDDLCFGHVPGGMRDGEYKKVDSLLFHLSSTLLHFFIVVILIMPAFIWTIMMNRNSDVLQVNCGTLDLLAGQCTAPSNFFSGIIHPAIAFFLLLFYVYSISAYLFRDIRKVCLYYEAKKYVYNLKCKEDNKRLENDEIDENKGAFWAVVFWVLKFGNDNEKPAIDDQTVWKGITLKAGETALRRSANKRDIKRKEALKSIGNAIDQWNTTSIRFLLGDIGDKIIMKIVENELECRRQPMLTFSRENPLPFLGLERGLCKLLESSEADIKYFRRNVGMRWFWGFSILFLVFSCTFIFMSFLLYLTLAAAVAPARIVPVMVSIGSTLRVALVTFANFEEKRTMLVKASLEALSSVQLDDPKCEICSEPLGDEPSVLLHCKHRFHTKCRDGLKEKFGIENGCRACHTGQTSARRELYEDACRIYFKLKELVGRDEASWSALTAQQQQQIKEVSSKLRDAADQGEEAAVAMLIWLTVDQRSEILGRGGFSSLTFDKFDKEAARCWFQKTQPDMCTGARKIYDSLLTKAKAEEEEVGQGKMDLHATADQERTRIQEMLRLSPAGAGKAGELHANLEELLDSLGEEGTSDLGSSATQAEDGKAGDRKDSHSKLLQSIKEEIARTELLPERNMKEGKGKLDNAAKKLKLALDIIKQRKTLKEKMLHLMATEFEKEDLEKLLKELCALDVEKLQKHRHFIALTPLAEFASEGGKVKLEDAAKMLKMALDIIKHSKTLTEKAREALFNELCGLDVEKLQKHEHFIDLTHLAEIANVGGKVKQEDVAKKLKMTLDIIKHSKTLTEKAREALFNKLCSLDVEELQQHEHFIAMTHLAELASEGGKKLENVARKLKLALGIIKQDDILKEKLIKLMTAQFEDNVSSTKEDLKATEIAKNASEALFNELCELDVEKLQQHEHFIAMTHLAEMAIEGGKLKLEDAAKELKMVMQSKALKEKMVHLVETEIEKEDLETLFNKLCALDVEELQQHEHFIAMTHLAEFASEGGKVKLENAAKKLKMVLDIIKQSKVFRKKMIRLMETEIEKEDLETLFNKLCALEVEELQQHEHFIAMTHLAEFASKGGKVKLEDAAKKLKIALDVIKQSKVFRKKLIRLMETEIENEDLETLFNELCALDVEELQQHEHFIAMTHLAELASEGGKLKLEDAAKTLKMALDIIKDSKVFRKKLIRLMETEIDNEDLETLFNKLCALDVEELQQHEHFIAMTHLAEFASEGGKVKLEDAAKKLKIALDVIKQSKVFRKKMIRLMETEIEKEDLETLLNKLCALDVEELQKHRHFITMIHLAEFASKGGKVKLEDAAKKLKLALDIIKQSKVFRKKMIRLMETEIENEDLETLLNELCALDVEELQQHEHFIAMTHLAELASEGGKVKLEDAAKTLKMALDIIKRSKTLKEKMLHLMKTEIDNEVLETLLNELCALDVKKLQKHRHFIAMIHLTEFASEGGKVKLEDAAKKLKKALDIIKQSKPLKEKMLHLMATEIENEDLETLLNELCALDVEKLQKHRHFIAITHLAEFASEGGKVKLEDAAKKLKKALDIIKQSKTLKEKIDNEVLEMLLDELCALDVEKLQKHRHFIAMTHLAELASEGGKAAKKLKKALDIVKQSKVLREKMVHLMETGIEKEDLEALLNKLCALDVEELQQHEHFIAMTHLAEFASEGGKVKLEDAAKKLKKALDIIKQSKTLTEKMVHLMETQFKDGASLTKLTKEDLEVLLKELSALDVERLQQHEHYIAMTRLAKQAMKYSEFMNQSQELVQDTLSGLGLGQGKAALITFLTALCFGAFAAFVIIGCALFVDTQDIYSTIVASAVMLSAAFSKQKEDFKADTDTYETYRILKEKFVALVVERLEEKKSELKTSKTSKKGDDDMLWWYKENNCDVYPLNKLKNDRVKVLRKKDKKIYIKEAKEKCEKEHWNGFVVLEYEDGEKFEAYYVKANHTTEELETEIESKKGQFKGRTLYFLGEQDRKKEADVKPSAKKESKKEKGGGKDQSELRESAFEGKEDTRTRSKAEKDKGSIKRTNPKQKPTKPYTKKSMTNASREEWVEKLFDLVDTDKSGTLSRGEVIAAAGKLKMTADKAARLFDELDKDKNGTLTRAEMTDGLIDAYSNPRGITSILASGVSLDGDNVSGSQTSL